ncbi:MAG: hypothetical protein ACOC5T_00425 [Elusimicrobiota bacterium]
MKGELLKFAKEVLELWEDLKFIKTPSMFDEDMLLFEEEPKCVKTARKIIKKYGE